MTVELCLIPLLNWDYLHTKFHHIYDFNLNFQSCIVFVNFVGFLWIVAVPLMILPHGAQ